MTVQTAHTEELTHSDTQKAPAQKRVYTPRAEVLEKPDSFAIVAEMPGVGEDSIDIYVADNVLSIHGKTANSVPDGYRLVVGEYVGGDYERKFTLSDRIDQAGISASIDRGVLTVLLPKTQGAASRRIEISGG